MFSYIQSKYEYFRAIFCPLFTKCLLNIYGIEHLAQTRWTKSNMQRKREIWLPRSEAFICRHSSKQVFLKTFANLTRETPVLKSIFNKVPGLKACNVIKKRFQHMFSCEISIIFINSSSGCFGKTLLYLRVS